MRCNPTNHSLRSRFAAERGVRLTRNTKRRDSVIMKLGLVILLVSHAVFAIAWIWYLFTLSLYIKPGKGWAFALTPFWIFFSDWFTQEGRPYLQKARKVIGLSLAVSVGSFVILKSLD